MSSKNSDTSNFISDKITVFSTTLNNYIKVRGLDFSLQDYNSAIKDELISS